jgi:hypothetical protein
MRVLVMFYCLEAKKADSSVCGGSGNSKEGLTNKVEFQAMREEEGTAEDGELSALPKIRGAS